MLKTVGNPSTRYGNQTVINGNVVIGTAGKGVDFSADSHAPGMTSELFNDYEEGTFTPSILFGGSGTGITYGTQTGRYTKIGRLVMVEGKITLTNKGSATGVMTLSGMPFNFSSNTSPSQVIDTIGGFNLLTIGGCLFFVCQQNTNYGYIMVQNSATNRGTIDNTYFNNSTSFTFQLTYTV